MEKVHGNSVNYKYRMHDPRIGRFFAVDPLSSTYPWNSPYAFSENRVIDAIELEGLECVEVNVCEEPINGQMGTAEIQIKATVFEINAGNNAIIDSDRISESEVESLFDKGDKVLYFTTLPSKGFEGELATSKDLRKFNKGKFKSEMWEVTVNYDIDYVKPEEAFTLEDFTKLKMGYERQSFGSSRALFAVAIPTTIGAKSLYREAEVANVFQTPEAMREHTLDISFYQYNLVWVPDYGYGSNSSDEHFGFPNGIDHSVTDLNGTYLTVFYLNSSEAIVHGLGHLMSKVHLHNLPDKSYEYSQHGLQSSNSGWVYSSTENTVNILNDDLNRWTIEK